MESESKAATSAVSSAPCRILSLDGGGAKGFYTLGVLYEVEALRGGGSLCEHFDLIYGTSTGGIIAALLALGYKVEAIRELYEKHVPTVMKNSSPKGRTEALKNLANAVFGAATFDDVRTDVGIVATHWLLERPMIFKSNKAQAHGRQSTFVPGFGCTVADAVRASCSAYPYFERCVLKTAHAKEVELFDGGYCANNPTLYAIADAVKALQRAHGDLRVLSVGVGTYPEPEHWLTPKDVLESIEKFFLGFTGPQLLQKTLNVNTTSMETLRSILFKDVPTVRVNDAFARPELATDLLESDLKKLNMLYQEGRESFARQEAALRHLFDIA